IISLFMNYLSRRHEQQADKYAANIYNHTYLVSALIKLSVKNLSNLNPHPTYVFVYYSHPPLLQRINNSEEEKNK
ncbi:MAG TPA: peptidase M48, partial [Bacteroidales bacterium]|nr:peptidase M48 [Bacteroidales bacterium]